MSDDNCTYQNVWDAPGSTIDEKMANNLKCAESRSSLQVRIAIMIVGIIVLLIIIGIGINSIRTTGIENYGSYLVFGFLAIGTIAFGFFFDKISINNARRENIDFNNAFTRRVMDDPTPPEIHEFAQDYGNQKRTQAAIQNAVYRSNSHSRMNRGRRFNRRHSNGLRISLF